MSWAGGFVSFVSPAEAHALRPLFSPPALGERDHRGLARQLVAVCRALDVTPVAARPHPGAALRCCRLQMEDAADDLAVFEHVVVVVAPLAGWARSRSTLENQRGHSCLVGGSLSN